MCEVNTDRLVKLFIDLVKIPSPSWQEGEVINYITKFLGEWDIGYEKYRCGDSHNLLVRINGDESKKPILFSSHMDTVIPCENVKPVVTDKRISSDGTTILGADDKAAIAVFLEAICQIKENNPNHGPIEFLFSCAEEVGLYGVKGFDLSLLNSKYAFVFDSEGKIGRIILKAPYHITMDVTITGKAAHAGIEPEKGINSIRVSSEIISKIPNGRIDDETTVNVGVISGGKATNIVTEETNFKLEVRSISNKKLHSLVSEIIGTIKSVSKEYNAKSKIDKRLEYTGFSIGQNEKIVKIIDKAIRKIRLNPIYEVSGGGSDTNIINKAGIKALNLSIGMRNVHTKKEYVLINDLVNGTRLVLSIIDSI